MEQSNSKDAAMTPAVKSRREFLKQTAGVASGMALAPLLSTDLEAQSNAFANPPEIVQKKGVLKGVIQLGDHVRAVPNMSDTHLRMFQGWDLSRSSEAAAPVA